MLARGDMSRTESINKSFETKSTYEFLKKEKLFEVKHAVARFATVANRTTAWSQKGPNFERKMGKFKRS